MFIELTDNHKQLILTIIDNIEMLDKPNETKWTLGGSLVLNSFDVISFLTTIYNANGYTEESRDVLNEIRRIWIIGFNNGNSKKYVNTYSY